ncbi:MAG: TMEM43 family protein [Nitrosomonadales bacterium]|nr:TMEM43 family protein [Nitrosomonadales bacterium]
MSDGDIQKTSVPNSDPENSDSFTEVTTESWFSRFGNALLGVVVGIIIFFIGFPVLFWNEGRAVETYKSLQEGAGIVISVPADKIDSEYEGKLIHLTGLAATDETLTDQDFGVSAKAIKLYRQTLMYQWKENIKSESEKNLGGSSTTQTTYSYAKVWSNNLIDSDVFKNKSGHSNPTKMAYRSDQLTASKVMLGAFKLSESLIGLIDDKEALSVDTTQSLPEHLQGKARWDGGILYIGNNPQSAEIGDIQVEFKVVKPQAVSIIAKQYLNDLAPYETSVGKDIEMLQMGTESPEQMFKQARLENKLLTWGLRFLGALAFFFGIFLILRPLSVLTDALPLLGDVMEAGIGLVAFVLAIALTLITVAIAWFYYRPLLSVALIVAALGIFMVFKKLRKPPAPQSA